MMLTVYGMFNSSEFYDAKVEFSPENKIFSPLYCPTTFPIGLFVFTIIVSHRIWL